jgi:short-subunit dehydrogenase
MIDPVKPQFRPPSRSNSGENTAYTLITGSSQGIGRAMAEECAARGMNLLLIALDNHLLPRAAQELRERYEVHIDYLGIDMTEKEATRRIYEWSREKGYPVNILINNAGFGRSGLFEKIDLQEYLTMIQLNNQALIELTYHFLPSLQQLPKAHIMNMSSMEATLPLPYKSVYTGTKNFVYAFSLALREELKESSVQVSVLCPGPVLTNEDGLKRIKSQGRRSKYLLMMPEEVAPIAITKMLQGKGVIIPGRFPSFLVKIARLFPTTTKMSILERIFRPYKYEAG